MKENTPADKRPDAETAQWPGDARQKPQTKQEEDTEHKRKTEKTVIPKIQ